MVMAQKKRRCDLRALMSTRPSLGRKLTPDDFIDAPVNDPNVPGTSSRLRARLSR
jgi:hypothetical protein